MSAPLAGKFQDHYKVLDIDSTAEKHEIEEACQRLRAIYQPERGTTPDKEAYEAVLLAQEVLLDVQARQIFDSLRAGNAKDAPVIFSREEFFTSMVAEMERRWALLCMLYDRRRLAPMYPGLSVRQVESMMYVTTVELEFATWYLKKRGWVVSDDKSNMQISVAGIEVLEQHKPGPEVILKHIREVPLDTNKPKPGAEVKQEEKKPEKHEEKPGEKRIVVTPPAPSQGGAPRMIARPAGQQLPTKPPPGMQPRPPMNIPRIVIPPK